MKITLESGRYIVAVSGGVDSIVLLELLRSRTDLELIVAHFDHGMRTESVADQEFVAAVARQYGLQYVHANGHLGAGASEADARAARYAFLHKMLEDHGALAVVTAHHQDDVLETAIINLSRGTGRRGLTSLRSTATIKRPLLGVTKAEIKDYAVTHELDWREDHTNLDTTYLRNHIRHNLLARIATQDRQQLLRLITGLQPVNDAIDALVAAMLQGQDGDTFDRQWLASLADDVAREVLAGWLRERGIGFERRTLMRAIKAITLQRPGSSVPLKSDYYLRIGRTSISLERLQR